MRMRIHLQTAILATILGGGLLLSGCNRQDQGAGHMGDQVPDVGVHTITARTLTLTTELAGRTSPYMISEVRPQVSGIILKRLFTEGGNVKAGAELYKIDPATYQAAYDSAKATRAKAKANLASASARASRYKELVAINAISKQEFDDADAALKLAEADVMAAAAAVETARINLAYTSVTAPISGRIGRSEVTPGALVTANQPTSMATVQQLDPIYVDVTQSSNEWLRLRRDMESGRLKSAGENQAEVELLLPDGSTYPEKGALKFSDVTVDQTTGSINIRAEFKNPTGKILPGMYVRARIVEGDRANAILVPQQGIMRDPKGNATAMVVGPDNTVSLRVLTTDRAIGNEWLVTDGLAVGEKVIVEGLQRIRFMPGAPAPKVKAEEINPNGQKQPAPPKGEQAAPQAQSDQKTESSGKQ